MRLSRPHCSRLASLAPTALSPRLSSAQAGLPAVDGRDLYSEIVNTNASARGGRTDALHLSPNAVLLWPWKLVTGAQPYAVWTSPRYPNCSVAASAIAGRGPEHADTRVFGVPIPYGSPDLQAHITWSHDCGHSPGCLFNLMDDPTEHIDVSSEPQHAPIAWKLAASLATLNATLFEPDRGTPSVEACLRGIEIGRFYGPFMHVPEGWYTPRPPPPPAQRRRDRELRAALELINRPVEAAAAVDAAKLLVPRVAFDGIFPTLDSCRNATDGTDPFR
jgi:hypothetical protein